VGNVSMGTALEIFNHPRDLYFSVSEHEGKYAFVISRGPGHNFKLLISADPVFEGREAVILCVQEILTGIRTHLEKELLDPSTIAAQFCNPSRLPRHMFQGLTAEYIDRIISDLQTQGSVSTSQY
jgi:hypothetical protein